MPRDRPVEVELGCAEGDFLFKRARVRPEAFYVGIEIRRPLARQVNERARKDGFPQIRAICANLLWDLDSLLDADSVDVVHILFPDPWFKRKHRKRRFLSRDLALQLAHILKPGGCVFFQSDVFDLALDALATLESLEPLFSNIQGPWRFMDRNPFKAVSRREQHCRKTGRPIWRLLFSKT